MPSIKLSLRAKADEAPSVEMAVNGLREATHDLSDVREICGQLGYLSTASEVGDIISRLTVIRIDLER